MQTWWIRVWKDEVIVRTTEQLCCSEEKLPASFNRVISEICGLTALSRVTYLRGGRAIDLHESLLDPITHHIFSLLFKQLCHQVLTENTVKTT